VTQTQTSTPTVTQTASSPAQVYESYLFYAGVPQSNFAPSWSGDGVNIQTPTANLIQFKDMNNPVATSKYETLNDFIARRQATNDRIQVINGDLCAQKNSLVFNITAINNPSSPVLEGRTTSIGAYLAYPASIKISGLQDLSAIGELDEFVDVTSYLGVTGSNISQLGNTAPTVYTPLKMGGVDYRVLKLGPFYTLGQTGAYKIDTCGA